MSNENTKVNTPLKSAEENTSCSKYPQPENIESTFERLNQNLELKIKDSKKLLEEAYLRIAYFHGKYESSGTILIKIHSFLQSLNHI